MAKQTVEFKVTFNPETKVQGVKEDFTPVYGTGLYLENVVEDKDGVTCTSFCQKEKLGLAWKMIDNLEENIIHIAVISGDASIIKSLVQKEVDHC